MVRNTLVGLVLVIFGTSLPIPAWSQPAAPGKKVALLIGVKRYKNVNFGNLNYTENDVVELAKILRPRGFEVTLLSDSQDKEFQPSKENILKYFDATLKKRDRDDMVIFGFAGHGLQFDGDKAHYFLPQDAEPNDSTTMISLKAVYEKLEECGAGVKLMFVDACRNQVKKDRFRTAFDGDGTPPPPRGVCTLISCSAGQSALEMNDLRHGLFFYHVLEGLRGKAKNGRGDITVLGLAQYAMENVEAAGFNQKPVLKGEVTHGVLVRLGSIPAPAEVETAKKEITNKIGMKLVRIEAGKFMMGSPEGEEGRSTNEGPRHEVRITKGFYLGKYAVTRGEFRKFVNEKGYKTEAEADGQGGYGYNAGNNVLDGGPEYTWRNTGFEQDEDHPVVNVSWKDAKAFCEWLSEKEGKRYGLPTEAQWEYACRGGTTTRYFTGDTEESVEGYANVSNPSLKKIIKGAENATTFAFEDGYRFTSPVGKFKPNPWGLYDMHGKIYIRYGMVNLSL